MIAVGAAVSDQQFLEGSGAGNFHFSGVNGVVENYGVMQGQSISLIGRRVANFGHVDVGAGTFMMLAGDEVWLRDHDSPILIRSDIGGPDPADADLPAVENAGHISARGGKVRLAAGDMLSFAVRQRAGASITANEIVIEGGEEGLVEVRGTLDARGDAWVTSAAASTCWATTWPSRTARSSTRREMPAAARSASAATSAVRRAPALPRPPTSTRTRR